MIDRAISIVRRSIKYAEDAGTYEVSEELKPLEEALVRRKCRMQMEFNGMTGYCVPGCCVNWEQCSQENGFDAHGEPNAPSVAKEPYNEADVSARNWFSGTVFQPNEPAAAG